MFDEYVNEARRLQVLYQPQIKLLVGCETEYIDEEQAQAVLQLRARHELDYTVGSIHHVEGHPIDINEENYKLALQQCNGSQDALFDHYFDEQFQMLRLFRPEVVGHFDLIRIFRPTAQFQANTWKKIERNIRYAVEYGALFEINSRAWRKGFTTAYPCRDVLMVAPICVMLVEN
jgi:histidinol-phosphatase (PHP family)